jgi:hypothetical protein
LYPKLTIFDRPNRLTRAALLALLVLALMRPVQTNCFAQATPVTVSHVNDNNGAQTLGVAVAGNYAFFANQYDGLRVYEVSDPAHPASVCHINDGGLAWSVTVAGSYAYVANGEDGLRIYDVSNPTNVLGIGHALESIPFLETRGVAVTSHYAVVANVNDGLRIYDVSNPTNPVSIGHAPAGVYAQAVAVSGNYAYLANDSDGLRIYDISCPTNPISVSQVYSGGSAEGVALSGTSISPALRVSRNSKPSPPSVSVSLSGFSPACLSTKRKRLRLGSPMSGWLAAQAISSGVSGGFTVTCRSLYEAARGGAVGDVVPENQTC